MAEDVSEADVTDDDEETLAKAGQLLCSNGQAEATAYATAQLRDSTQRPTVEMERVQFTDPRSRITMPSSRPGALTPAAPPAVASATARLPAGAAATSAMTPLAPEVALGAPPPSSRPVPPPFPGASAPPVAMGASSRPVPPLEPSRNSPSDAPTVAKGPPLVPATASGRSSSRGLAAAAVLAALVLGGAGLRFTLARGPAPSIEPAAVRLAAAPERAPEPPAAKPPAPEPVASAAPTAEPVTTAEIPNPPAPPVATAAPVVPAAPPPPVAETAKPAPADEPVKAAPRALAAVPVAKPRVATPAPVAPAAPPVAAKPVAPAVTSHRVFGSED